jgi:polygalacturonase
VWTFYEFEEGGTSALFNKAKSVQESELFLASAALNNTEAFNKAIEDALPGDTILVPDERAFTFIGGIIAQEKHHITIDIAGSAHFLHDVPNWPVSFAEDDEKTPYYDPCLFVVNCTFLTITSSSETRARAEVNYKKNSVNLVDSTTLRGGILNGNGKGWWDDVIAGRIPKMIGDGRPPHLILITESADVHVEKLTLLNSPFWTLEVEVVRVEINDINVLVDRKYQSDLLARLITKGEMERKLDEDVGMHFPFPIDDLPDWVGRRLRQPQDLNTDGIDLRGRDIYVHDCIIQNADDSVAVKPLHIQPEGSTSILPNCTTNVTVENMVLTGFGASIGSVGPTSEHNCVDGVIFRNISMPGTGKGKKKIHHDAKGNQVLNAHISHCNRYLHQI